jgi:hypothetical protein
MGITFTAIRMLARTVIFGLFGAHNLLSQPVMGIKAKPTVMTGKAIRTG